MTHRAAVRRRARLRSPAATRLRSRSAYLLLPIAIVILFSFNDPTGHLQLHLGGLHVRQLDATGTASRDPERRRSPRSRSASSRRSPRPLLGTLIALALVRHRLPWPRRHEPADLPADVDARDRARRVAADAVPQHERHLHVGFWTIFIAHVMFMRQLRRRDGEGAADRLRPSPRGGGDGSRRQRVRRRSARSRCR